MPNERIIEYLKKLEREKRQDGDRWRAISYNRAVKRIADLDHEIRGYDDARAIEGIGDSIAQKIAEIVETGHLQVVDETWEANRERMEGIANFERIWKVGPEKAAQLWERGFRTFDDLREGAGWEALTGQQRIGLKYVEDFEKRVPRKEVTEIAKRFRRVVKMIERRFKIKLRCEVCGSYRRRRKDCGDVDFLLAVESRTGDNAGVEDLDVDFFGEMLGLLHDEGVLTDDLAVGSHKYNGVTRTVTGTYFRIDIQVIDLAHWPFALLYFTGSGRFNMRQRMQASKLGYSLSENGLVVRKTGEPVPGLLTELDIFQALGMEWVEPKNRK